MKLFQKKKNNKGFSLVELIVVVAIMAVLIGVLVPTLIKNVEKSRLSKDKTALDEVKNAIEVTLADEAYMDAACTDLQINSGATVNLSSADGSLGTDIDVDAFWKEVQSNLGTKTSVTLSSKLKSSGTTVKLTIKDGHATISVAPATGSSLSSDYTFTVGE